jgi:hypothetical protein
LEGNIEGKYMPAEELFDVFLSYSHTDTELVEELAKKIEDDANLKVWLDKWILVPGGKWQRAIASGLKTAKSCAVCIGEQTPAGWFREEIERALSRQTDDASFRVIPVLLPKSQEINIDDFLELRTWVDFRNGLNDKKAFHYLVCGIKDLAPGRFKDEDVFSDIRLTKVRNKLAQLQQLHRERLIDDANLSEYRCRLLDKLIEI